MNASTRADAPGRADHDWFVEQMGLVAETDGLPRIAGRVFGHLLLAERPCSLDELAAALGVSKASVSTDARLLSERRLVERVGQPGDRRDYYQLAPDFFRRLVEYRIARWAAIGDLAARYRARTSHQPPAVARRLDHVDAAHRQIVAELARVLAAPDAAGLSTAEGAR